MFKTFIKVLALLALVAVLFPLQPGATYSPGGMTLLRASSGTNTNAAAANVDTVTISNLTALDTLYVVASLRSHSGTTPASVLYNNTDAVALATSPVSIGDTIGNAYSWRVRQDFFANTSIFTDLSVSDASNLQAGGQRTATVVTPWGNTWVMALRHGGVPGGSTLYWSWAVYKLAGQ